MEQLWVEPVGNMIVARVRGLPTEDLLKEAQNRILHLVRKTERHKILYDALEMDVPPIDVPVSQWELDQGLDSKKLCRAIVVPNTKLAYLARIAFAEENHRVFYNDLSGAVSWLDQQ